VLVFANKQDLPGALSVDEISKELQLNKIRENQVKLFSILLNNDKYVFALKKFITPMNFHQF
jgi:signal recognition particle receptor subunit beta